MVKRVKAAISHSDGTPRGMELACHIINLEQRPDKSGSPAELFLNRSGRFPGLPTIPHKVINNSNTKERREGSRAKQTKRLNKGLRKPEVFKTGDKVYLRDQDGHWKIPAMVRSQRKHQGFDTPSYLLRNLTTGTTTTRNERDIWKFPGDADQTASMTDTPADSGNVTTSIMKRNEYTEDPDRQTADFREQLGHTTEGIYTDQLDSDGQSLDQPPVHTSSDPTEVFEEQACSLKTSGHIAWAKEIQVI